MATKDRSDKTHDKAPATLASSRLESAQSPPGQRPPVGKGAAVGRRPSLTPSERQELIELAKPKGPHQKLTPQSKDARYRLTYDGLADELVLGRFVQNDGRTAEGTLHAPFGCGFVFERWPEFKGEAEDIEVSNEIERKKRRVALGTAFCNLWPEGKDLTIPNLRREFWRVMDTLPSVASEIDVRAYGRAWHSQRSAEERRWRGELKRDGIAPSYQRWREEESPAVDERRKQGYREMLYQGLRSQGLVGESAADPAGDVLSRLDFEDWLESVLTPTERATLQLILSEEPVVNEADKKRRSRLRAKMRSLMEQRGSSVREM